MTETPEIRAESHESSDTVDSGCFHYSPLAVSGRNAPDHVSEQHSFELIIMARSCRMRQALPQSPKTVCTSVITATPAVSARGSGTQRELNDAGNAERECALLLVEPAFRPDQNPDFRPYLDFRPRARRRPDRRLACFRRRTPAAGRLAIARSCARSRFPVRPSGTRRTPHCSAASITFARIRSRLTRDVCVRRVMIGRRRAAPISTAF